MSCYISYKDLESTLNSAYRQNFEKYKNLEAVIESVMNLSIQPEAKVHAIWYYSGFVNTAAYSISELQTKEWSQGVYEKLKNYLEPFLKGEQDFNYEDIINQISEFFPKVEIESTVVNLENSILDSITDLKSIDDSSLGKEVDSIINQILSFRSELDPVILDAEYSTSLSLLQMMKSEIADRLDSPGKTTAIDRIESIIRTIREQNKSGFEYQNLAQTEGIGRYGESLIHKFTTAEGEVYEAVYDATKKVYRYYAPGTNIHLAEIQRSKKDKISTFYFKDNISRVNPETLKVRMLTDEIINGMALPDTKDSETGEYVIDQISADMPVDSSFYTFIQIKANTNEIQTNADRLNRIKFTYPNLARILETMERPNQASALGRGEGPILTFAKPTTGFNVVISNFIGDKSISLDRFIDLAFVYPNNEVVMVDFNNPVHMGLLKNLIETNLTSEQWRADINDVRYDVITDKELHDLKNAIMRYRQFEIDVNNRLEIKGNNADIKDIFYKYYDITNALTRVNFDGSGASSTSLGALIDEINGRLPVMMETIDEDGKPIGEPQDTKIPIVLRKNKGVWEVVTTLEDNQRIVGRDGTKYRSVDEYLTFSEGFPVREYATKNFDTFNSLYVSFRSDGSKLIQAVVPLVYQKQATTAQDLLSLVGNMKQSFGNAQMISSDTTMVTLNNEGWGFNMIPSSGVRPQMVILSQDGLKKKFGIEFNMLSRSTNNENIRDAFDNYAKERMKITFDSDMLNDMFDQISKIYQAAGITADANANVNDINKLTGKAIQILGQENELVKKLQSLFDDFVLDIKNKFKKVVNEHDVDLAEGRIAQPIIDNTFRNFALFDEKNIGTPLKLTKRGVKEDMSSAYYKANVTYKKELNLSSRNPIKPIFLAIKKEAIAGISDTVVDLPVVEIKPKQPIVEPAITAGPIEYIDPNTIATEDSDVPYSLIDSLEGFFALNEQEQIGEINAMKALLPNTFSFVRENFNGLNVDGHALGYIQDLVIKLNSELKARGVAYHEGFHGVFRKLLNNDLQKFYLQKVGNILGDYKTDDKGKYIAVNGKRVYANEFAKMRRYGHLTDEQLKYLIYEEYLADSFADYMKTNKVPHTWMEKLMAFLKKIVNYFKKGGRIQNLYYDISIGKFKNAKILDNKSNVETMYSMSYSGMPYLTLNNNNQLKKFNQPIQSYIVAELRDNLLYEMASLKVQYPDLTNDSLYDIAVTNILEKYDINNLISQKPELESKIREAYAEHYDNANWLLGTFGTTDKIFKYKNATRLPFYDNQQIDPIKDTKQVEVSKSNATSFKRHVLTEFDTIYVETGEENIDALAQSDDKDDQESEIGESYKDVSFVGIAPGEGTAAFRKLFKYIPYEYVDPRFGIKRTRMVDSNLIFSTIRKVTANIKKEDIVQTILDERDRLTSEINHLEANVINKLSGNYYLPDDIAKMIDLRDSLTAVYATLNNISSLNADGFPTRNADKYIQFVNVFSTIDARLLQIELITSFNYTEDKIEYISEQDYKMSDIVIGSDLNKIRTELKQKLYAVNMSMAEAKPSLDKLAEVNQVFSSDTTVKAKFFTDNNKLNDAKLQDFIDEIYVALSTFNLGISYNTLAISMAYLVFENTGSNLDMFSKNSQYRQYLRANKFLINDIKELKHTFWGNMIPSAVKVTIQASQEEKKNFSNEQLEAGIRRVTTAYVNTMGEFILKYDPTIGGSVTKNAAGDLINKYVKPTPAYVSIMKLQETNDIRNGLNNLIDEYFKGFEGYFENNPMLNIDNPVIKKFLENISVSAFAGFQQKFKLNSIKESDPTTFKGIDDKSYLLSMFGLFVNRKELYVPEKDTRITTFKRILTQYEATSTSIVVDGIYKEYANAAGISNKVKEKILYVNDLLAVVRQEYELIRKNFQDQNKEGVKRYKDYNTPNGRGFTFNILSDFFAVNVNNENRNKIKDRLVQLAQENVSFDTILSTNQDIIEEVELELASYGQEQYFEFDRMIASLGITEQDLPTSVNVAGLKKNFFFNNWINSIFVNQIFDGPIAVTTKDAAEFYKRQKSGAATGDNLYNPIRSEFGKVKTYRAAVLGKIKFYIDNIFLTNPMQLDQFDKTDKDGNPIGIQVDAFDGQSIGTIDRRIRISESEGKVDYEAQDIMRRMKYITQDTEKYKEDIEKLSKRDIVFNSVKSVTAAGLQYIKQSEHTIIRKDVSYLDPTLYSDLANFELEDIYTQIEFYDKQLEIGNNSTTVDEQTGEDISYEEMHKRLVKKAHSYFKPRKGRELLHNLLNSMEYHRVEQLMDETSSKKATVLPLVVDMQDASSQGYMFELDNAIEDVPLDLTYIQVGTSKIANVITNGIQQKLLIIAQLDPNDPAYAAIKKDIEGYQTGLYEVVLAQTQRTMRMLNTSDSRVVAKLYDNIAQGLREQGGSTTDLQWFEINLDGTPKHNPNLTDISRTISYYYFSLFNKAIFDKKVAGKKYYHISPVGYQIIEKDGKIITQDEYLKNPDKYADATTRYPTIKEEEYEEVNAKTGRKEKKIRYVVEVIVPKELKELDQKFVEKYLTEFFATRIPTEGRRSMMVARIVDYIDEAYGAGIIVPFQMHMLAGSDFDIDTLYAYVKSSYRGADGTKSVYGDYSHYKEKYGMSEKDAQFIEYLTFMGDDPIVKDIITNEIDKIENQGGFSQEFVERFGSLFGGTIETYINDNYVVLRKEKDSKTYVEETKKSFKRLIATYNILEKLSDVGLPTTPDELVSYKKKNKHNLVVNVTLNNILQYKINILSNPTVFQNSMANTNQRADEAVKDYKDLVNEKGLSEREIYSKQNLYTPTALILARSLNSDSKDSLGIAASFAKGTSMLATIDAKLSKPVGYVYGYNKNGKPAKIATNNEISLEAVDLVGGSIGLFADAVRNPYPGVLHLNTITVPVMLSMFAVGMPKKAAIMFQSLPVVKLLVQKYNQTYGSSYSPTQFQRDMSFLKYLNNQIGELQKQIGIETLLELGIIKTIGTKGETFYDNKSYKLVWTGNINKEMNDDISNWGFEVLDSKNNRMVKDVENFILMNEFNNYSELGNDISFKITSLTDTMKSLKPDQDRFDRLRNTFVNTRKGKTLFTDATIKNLFIKYPVLGANQLALEYMNKMSKLVMLERTSFMKGLTSLFSNIYGYDINDIRSDIKAFLQLQLQRSSMESEPDNALSRIYLEILNPEVFTKGDVVADYYELLRLFPQNQFLNSLKVVTEGTTKNMTRMLELNVSKLSPNQKDILHADLLFLMGAPMYQDPITPDSMINVKEKAFRIAYYGMIKSGAQRKKGSYQSILPTILSKPASDALFELQKDLIELDNIIEDKYTAQEDIDGELKLPYGVYEEFNEKLNEIVGKNFAGLKLENLITSAVTKIISSKLMTNEFNVFKRTITADKYNKKTKKTITNQQIIDFFNKVAPASAANIITDKGLRPVTKLNTRNVKPNEYELFTLSDTTLNLDLSELNDEQVEMLNILGIWQSGNKFNFPLYRQNIYGQMLVLKKIDGQPLGKYFIDTLSKTIANPTTDKMQLLGITAQYEAVAKEGTSRISPLAFTNQEGATITNIIMGQQQLQSERIDTLPMSLQIVRTANRAYELSTSNMPSGKYNNRTFATFDLTTVQLGSELTKFQFLRGDVFYWKNATGNYNKLPLEQYDNLAQKLGYESWEYLKQASKFQDFFMGKMNIFMFNMINGDTNSPTAQPIQQPTQSSTSVKEGIKIPAYTVDINLTNANGTKRLASTSGTTIKLNPVNSVQEFFNYFEGNEVGPSSAQKKMVLVEMEKQGYPLKKIKSILNTTKLANTFLVLHEQDHIDQNDVDVYWKMSKSDLLTPDKLLIETRASINALKKIESTQSSTSVNELMSSSEVDDVIRKKEEDSNECNNPQ